MGKKRDKSSKIKTAVNKVLVVIFTIITISLLAAFISVLNGSDCSMRNIILLIVLLVVFGTALTYNIIVLEKRKSKPSSPAERNAVAHAPNTNLQSVNLQTREIQFNEIINRFGNTTIPSICERIPKNIFDLLWFSNGPLQNYFGNSDNVNFEVAGQNVHVTTNLQKEPSAIDITLPVTDTITAPTPLGYFPSYERLTPQERTAYLNWLTDITAPIDIGYVFLFYYGLERHLLFGNSEGALDTIMLLRKYHKNDSFLFYSGEAVVLYSLIHQRYDILQSIDKSQIPIDLRLLINAILQNAFSAEDIVDAHAKFGFTNTRYIKNEPRLFLSTLQDLMIQRYSAQEFQIQDKDYGVIKGTMLIELANCSLSPEQRHIELPDISTSPRIQSEINSLLVETHETVKIKLREQRKKHLSNTISANR